MRVKVILMRNPFSRIPQPGEHKTNHGESVKIIYRGRYAADGSVELFEFERVDLQKEINSYRGQCDLRYLMQRFNAGDSSVLKQRVPMYGDFSTIPNNFVDLYNMVHGAEEFFEQLPADIKKTFNNNPVDWFASMGNVDWFERMSPKPIVPDVKDGDTIVS